MTSILFLELAAKSVVIAGAGLAILQLVRRRSAAERSFVAHSALLALLALPMATFALPKVRLAEPQAALQTAPIAASGLDVETVLQAAYTAVAAALLVGMLIGVARLFLLRRQATVVVDAPWLTALARAQRRMGVKSGAALLVSDAVNSPVSWGFLRPTILLNETVVSMSDDAEAIIAHELAHVVRRDWAKLLAGRVATALFWFNPLVWVLVGQCHQLREEAADDTVLRSEVPSADYANLLVKAARHDCRAALIAAHGVAPGKGSLHLRVTRVLDGALRRGPARAAWTLCCLGGAALFAAPLAALTLAPAQPLAPAQTVRMAAAPTTAPAAKTLTARAAPRATPVGVTTTAGLSRNITGARTLTTTAPPMVQAAKNLTADAARPATPASVTTIAALSRNLTGARTLTSSSGGEGAATATTATSLLPNGSQPTPGHRLTYAGSAPTEATAASAAARRQQPRPPVLSPN